MQFIFSASAEREFKKLPRSIQIQITKKLEYFLSSEDPLTFGKHLTDFELGEYRFRIGDYRVVVDIKEDKLYILHVGHRREIYRR